MNRDELIEGIMRHAGISKANVGRFYDGLAELVRGELQRRKEFVLPGLGVLKVRQRSARAGRNPQTGQTIHIAARKVVRFKAYSALDELLNGPGRASRRAEPEKSGQLPLDEPPAGQQ